MKSTPTPQRGQRGGRNGELNHDSVLALPMDSIRPSPENEQLYRPIDPNAPDIIGMASSIREDGVQQALVVTRDRWIVSGHRRYAAATLAGLAEVPCRILPFDKDEDHDRFMQLLLGCNRSQRVKSLDEALREELLSVNPEEAYQALVEHRRQSSQVSADTIDIRERKERAEISDAKGPFLNAVIDILHDRREFWPLSDRQIHYALLNDPPLIHASKPRSRYRNDKPSYQALVNLVTRARLEERIPMDCIADETRPQLAWHTFRAVQDFIRSELGDMFKGFWRDLMQSQSNHFEIVGEKNTVLPIVKPVAAYYTIPLTIGRGYCSLPPRYNIARRYRASGKERLVLLILSDFDPDGEEIAHSLARSLRDDFGISKIKPIKVALTADQVDEFHLPPKMKAKKCDPKTRAKYDRFVEQRGSDDVFELEAIQPKMLQELLRGMIDSVIDIGTFNHELDQEKQDAAYLDTTRRKMLAMMGAMGDIDQEGSADE